MNSRKRFGVAITLTAMCIVASCDDNVTAPADDVVAPREVGSVLLLPDSLTVSVGETAQLTVIVRDKTGAVIRWAPGDVEFRCGTGLGALGSCWLGNDEIFADITSSGLVTHVSYPIPVGPEPVVARYQGMPSNTIWLSTVPQVGSVLLSPDSLTVAVGETAQLTVIVRNKAGRVIPWAPGDVEFRCGTGLGVPGRCRTRTGGLSALITSGGIVHALLPDIGPEPVVARYLDVSSNTIWLTTR